MVEKISPARARALMDDGAVLIDIREGDERRREYIPGSEHHPLSAIGGDGPARQPGRPVIFHCRSGMRTASNEGALCACAGDTDVYLLDGGLGAWREAGLDVVSDDTQPLDIMRQVQITAGMLILTGTALGALVHPGFLALDALVGIGILHAGLSGSCLMANLLSFAPWNRAAAAQPA